MYKQEFILRLKSNSALDMATRYYREDKNPLPLDDVFFNVLMAVLRSARPSSVQRDKEEIFASNYLCPCCLRQREREPEVWPRDAKEIRLDSVNVLECERHQVRFHKAEMTIGHLSVDQFLEMPMNVEEQIEKDKSWLVNSWEVEWRSTNLLGRGGFGAVYKGVWRQQDVAVKRMLAPEMHKEEDAWRQFVAECDIMGYALPSTE